MEERKRNRVGLDNLLGLVALVALVGVGVSLLMTNILDKTSMDTIKQIATIAMYVVLGVVSFYYCSLKNNPIWFGLWGLAVALIVLANVL